MDARREQAFERTLQKLRHAEAQRDRLRALCIRLRDWVSLPGVQISGGKEWGELEDIDHEMAALGIENGKNDESNESA